ncbi:MAG TPA: AGE family epimerase/isomerase, partial [Fimbriimonadaceae bacterium]|nr:AGE family epimerase/isomerase [Fimbriimonadaceae bacterium]
LDPENGGPHWMVDLSGKPLGTAPPVKLAYGLAFALYGLSAAARVLGEESAHQQASSAFEFLERLHDDAYGGYFESCEADGTPLSITRPKAEGRAFGPSGGTSRKSQNTQLHILEALLEYQKLDTTPAITERIRELTDLMKGAMFAEPGVHRTRFEADWTPIDSRWEIGHDLEAAFLLLAADPDDEARKVAESLLKFNIGHGFDQEHGGFFDSGPRPGEVGERVKVWWVQAEALNALTYGLAHLPDLREALLTVLELQWHWFRRHQWDEEFDGFFARLEPDGTVRGGGDKAEPWKACYHDVRALLNLVHAGAS